MDFALKKGAVKTIIALTVPFSYYTQKGVKSRHFLCFTDQAEANIMEILRNREMLLETLKK